MAHQFHGGSNSQKKNHPPVYDDKTLEAVRLLARTAMTSENSHEEKDHLMDDLIGLARVFVEREQRSERFLKELK